MSLLDDHPALSKIEPLGNLKKQAVPTVSEEGMVWTAKITAELQYHTGSDVDIARAAWVSTKGQRAEDESSLERVRGLLSYLLRNNHGTPFEHGSMTFLVNAPIFVWREHMRHRIGISYNEQSGRYMEIAPKFYLPLQPRVRVGKPGRYHYQIGTPEQNREMETAIRIANRIAYNSYRIMLNSGIAPEVARMALPVNIYSSAYVTFNPRSLMHFLTLRQDMMAQQEIRQLAHIYDGVFENAFPITYDLYHQLKDKDLAE